MCSWDKTPGAHFYRGELLIAIIIHKLLPQANYAWHDLSGVKPQGHSGPSFFEIAWRNPALRLKLLELIET